jgi:signal peptidase II
VNSNKNIILAVLAPFVFVFDFLSKAFIMRNFASNEGYVVIENFFNLTYIQNRGVAFGFLANVAPDVRTPLIFGFPLLSLLLLVIFFYQYNPANRKMVCALSIMIGGAIGNLIDRFRFGHVVDFFDFHWRYQFHFPAFNLADLAIFTGVGLLVVDLILMKNGNVQ